MIFAYQLLPNQFYMDTTLLHHTTTRGHNFKLQNLYQVGPLYSVEETVSR